MIAMLRRTIIRSSIASLQARHHSNSSAVSNMVRVFVLTGGPCGGKTSALASLSSRIPQISDYRVVHVPELSTLFHTAGSHYPALGTPEDQLNWDYEKLKAQLALEDAFRHIAEKSGKPTILLCDRGAFDSKVFVSDEDWTNLYSALGYDEPTLLERYDAVVHLVTTAIGAEAHYTGASGNAARRETIEEARIQDHSIRQAWMKHPNFLLISNNPMGSTFEDKLRRTTESVCSHVGIPTPSDVKRQWIVTLDEFDPASSIRFHIETDFISSTDYEDVSVRRIVLVEEDAEEAWPAWDTPWPASTTYSLHERSLKASRAMKRSDRRMNKREWQTLLGRVDEGAGSGGSGDGGGGGGDSIAGANNTTIRMKRTCFVHDEMFWKLDEIVSEEGLTGVCLLTVEGVGMDENIRPPFCLTHREVSLLSLRDLKDMDMLARRTRRTAPLPAETENEGGRQSTC